MILAAARKAARKKTSSKKSSGRKVARSSRAQKQSTSGKMATLAKKGDPKPKPLKGKDDEPAEVIGSLLWAAFTRGVEERNRTHKDRPPKSFWTDVIEKGRYNSRGWVHEGVEDFNYGLTMICAEECGKRSYDKAEARGAVLINATDFHDAWKKVSELMPRYMRIARAFSKSKRKGGDRGMLGGACG
jgi:hypothetical protein